MIKTALVTGGNRGIGLAIAGGLAAKDIRVIIGSRNEQAGVEAARSLGVESVQLDVSDDSSIAAAVSRIGDIDILVNNAGVLGSMPLLEGFRRLAALKRVRRPLCGWPPSPTMVPLAGFFGIRKKFPGNIIQNVAQANKKAPQGPKKKAREHLPPNLPNEP